MSTKENAAVSQLLALLEARYAMRVLWALRDGHPQTFRLLQDSVGGITPNTLNTRIKELREAGLVSHGGDGYSLTVSGQDLLKRLSDLQAFAGKWQLGQIKKAAAPATAATAPPSLPPSSPPPSPSPSSSSPPAPSSSPTATPSSSPSAPSSTPPLDTGN